MCKSKGPLMLVSKRCEFCGDEYAVTPDEVQTRRFCTRQCSGFAKMAPSDGHEIRRLNHSIAELQFENGQLRALLGIMDYR